MAAYCIPIVGFNIGADKKDRVKELVTKLLIAEASVDAVGYKNRTCIGLNLSNWIEIDHIFYIAPAQLHRTAVDDLRDILGIKLGKHHFALIQNTAAAEIKAVGTVSDLSKQLVLTDLRSKVNQHHPLQRKRS